MGEKDLMAKLVDKYGFSYAVASEIAAEDNAVFILQCIVKAYEKGKGEYAQSWSNSSYG